MSEPLETETGVVVTYAEPVVAALVEATPAEFDEAATNLGQVQDAPTVWSPR